MALLEQGAACPALYRTLARSGCIYAAECSRVLDGMNNFKKGVSTQAVFIARLTDLLLLLHGLQFVYVRAGHAGFAPPSYFQKKRTKAKGSISSETLTWLHAQSSLLAKPWPWFQELPTMTTLAILAVPTSGAAILLLQDMIEAEA